MQFLYRNTILVLLTTILVLSGGYHLYQSTRINELEQRLKQSRAHHDSTITAYRNSIRSLQYAAENVYWGSSETRQKFCLIPKELREGVADVLVAGAKQEVRFLDDDLPNTHNTDGTYVEDLNSSLFYEFVKTATAYGGGEKFSQWYIQLISLDLERYRHLAEDFPTNQEYHRAVEILERTAGQESIVNHPIDCGTN